MQVYLVRHGIAENQRPGSSDADRALTDEGRRKLKTVLQSASETGLKPTLILSSPLRRAIQTAEIAQDVLGYKNEIIRTNALTPSSSVEDVWEEIRAHRDEASLMLVGHNPLFDDLAAYLLGSGDVQVNFKKGAILRVDFDAFPARPKGILRWYLTPKLASKKE